MDTSRNPVIIDLTKDSPPDAFEPIFLGYGNNSSVQDTRPNDIPHKERSRKRKKRSNLEDGELLESSSPTSRSDSRNAVAPHTKTVSWHDIDTEEHRDRKHPRYRDHSRERTPSPMTHLPPSDDTFPLFFIDINPTPIPLTDNSPKPEPFHADAEDNCKLLLPAHVSVFGSADKPGPVEILPPSSPHLDDGSIQYLDYNDSKVPGLVRYFDEATDDTKPTRFMCKNCGLEGEHKTSECPVKICLTCGAHDEHSTRSCPISKTCFSCGMKGHINRTCPNRYAAGVKDIGEYYHCDRCGSETHKTNECPTLWRIYEYLSDNDREGIFHLREEKRKLVFGEGGEGYIAPDEWCYNCGDCGHLGDDCDEVPHLFDIPGEPSAFSEYNTMSGPFDLNDIKLSTVRRRKLRDWELDGRSFDASANVGREGRKKERARMEQKAKEQEANNDSDDWFGNPRNDRNRGTLSSSHRSGGRVKKLDVMVKDMGRQFVPPSPVPLRHTDSLLNRLGGSGDQGKPRGRYQDRSSGGDSLKRRPREHKVGDRHGRRDSGPRYKGGYSR